CARDLEDDYGYYYFTHSWIDYW
nr:immunoglobulin heavy chain junction region [Macaca mulatta]MOW21432.1 immunoglobulin heavy chain junction region [Macaca mulatta]MOW21862.1 immunoglobulin heavy chain junction region [Macaca mulatta]